ncbi:MAG: HD domain-containing protein [Prevotella sp.]|nr:HD domain-containing protein [Prevotella sp.]
MKEQFIKLLQATKRTGIESVVSYLEQAGFFLAPASVSRHLSHEGGLLEHSLNVWKMAQMLRLQTIGMRPELEKQLPEDSVTIAALLHDVCKANIYKTVQKWRKDENNRWESYDAYDTDYSRFPVGHGEKSVIMLLRLGLQLTNDEIIAIRWHMGAWNLPMQSYEDKQNISVAYDGCPLAAIIQAADALATHILETKKEES